MITKPLMVEGGLSTGILETLSTLPLSYRVAPRGTQPDIVIIDGTEGWVDRATRARESACRGVLVVDPATAEPDTIRRLRSASSIPVVLSEKWADDPAIEAAASMWSHPLGSVHSAEVVLVERSPLPGDDATIVLLRVLRRLSIHGVTLDSSVTTASTTLQLAHTDRGTTVRMMRIANRAGNGRLRVVAAGATDRIDIELDSPGIARPGVARRVHANGADVLPRTYETSARRALLRLRDAVIAGEPVDELAGFADDVETIAQRG